MPWFDAICHSFSTMGLGGFSTHDASYGFFNSALIEGVTIVFMLLAGINFATHFQACRERSARPYRVDPEAGLFLLITLASCVMIACFLWSKDVYPAFMTALRHASFNAVSIATTTGFSSVDYNLWPMFAPLWMLFLCCFASCSGSTGGGIKMIRALLLVRQGLREMVKLVHPHAQVPVKLAGAVEDSRACDPPRDRKAHLGQRQGQRQGEREGAEFSGHGVVVGDAGAPPSPRHSPLRLSVSATSLGM